MPHTSSRTLSRTSPITLAIFCKVVDNFGDIGICWRLSRQLQVEHGVAVTLWVDDLRSFQRIAPAVDIDAQTQQVAGVTVRHWANQDGVFSTSDIADIVIEFFGCDIPEGYIAAMAQCTPRPVWLNLEGMSAEEWVEGCHTLPSSHPRLPITKHFFFPGFTSKTGGLLREAALEAQREQFLADPSARAAFLARLGVTAAEAAAFTISLFCYPHAPVPELFSVWREEESPMTCLVPEGVATEAVAAFIGAPANAGAAGTQGSLTVRVIPFVPQPDYDKLLWSCEVNIVRGEDSIVRAQWAAKPFVWHIYPQDENLHHKKLRAFLDRFVPAIDSLQQFSMAFNGAPAQGVDWGAAWRQLHADLPAIEKRATQWRAEMVDHGDLAGNLLKFASSLRESARQSKV
ncbi:MAG: elongation factor P maturation arginine rhamnosyltransferase EarP [Massilia sp.]